MKKFIVYTLLLLIFAQSEVFSDTRTVTTYTQVPSYGNYNNNIYNSDLTVIEEYLFGTSYKKENYLQRMNRIEKRIFNKIFTDITPTERMNNILANYRNDYYYNNYLPNNRNKTFGERLMDRFIGYPTGYTPPVMNTPYNDYGYPIGINRGYTSNRGYGFHNYSPSTGAGIHILE